MDSTDSVDDSNPKVTTRSTRKSSKKSLKKCGFIEANSSTSSTRDELKLTELSPARLKVELAKPNWVTSKWLESESRLEVSD